MQQLLSAIVATDILHGQWLNALSFMENAGARKISACENPYQVTFLQLKHAAEEHRHAYYLKKQIQKLAVPFPDTYAKDAILGGMATFHYLQRLDIYCSKFLKNNLNLAGSKLRFASYLLVTYAIEVRADLLYPIYQNALEQASSKVMVKSIIVEEQGHLEEMIAQLNACFANWEELAASILDYEAVLHKEWITAIAKEIA